MSETTRYHVEARDYAGRWRRMHSLFNSRTAAENEAATLRLSGVETRVALQHPERRFG